MKRKVRLGPRQDWNSRGPHVQAPHPTHRLGHSRSHPGVRRPLGGPCQGGGRGHTGSSQGPGEAARRKGCASPGVGCGTLAVQGEASRTLRACRGTRSAGLPEPTLTLRVRQADGARGDARLPPTRHCCRSAGAGPSPTSSWPPLTRPLHTGRLQPGPGEGKRSSVAPLFPTKPFLLPLREVSAPKAPPFLARFPHAHSPPRCGERVTSSPLVRSQGAVLGM